MAKFGVILPPVVIGNGIIRAQANRLAIVFDGTLMILKVIISKSPKVVGIGIIRL